MRSYVRSGYAKIRLPAHGRIGWLSVVRFGSGNRVLSLVFSVSGFRQDAEGQEYLLRSPRCIRIKPRGCRPEQEHHSPDVSNPSRPEGHSDTFFRRTSRMICHFRAVLNYDTYHLCAKEPKCTGLLYWQTLCKLCECV